MLQTLVLLVIALLFITPQAQADELYQDDVAQICSGMNSSSRTDKCMKVIKGKNFDEHAARFCGRLKYWSKIEPCLKLTGNKHFDERPFNICTSGSSFSERQKSCLRKIANRTFVSNIEVKMCAKKNSETRRVNCIKSASTKAYTPDPSKEPADGEKISRSEIKSKVREAYKLLRANKNTDATLILHDLLGTLDKEERQ